MGCLWMAEASLQLESTEHMPLIQCFRFRSRYPGLDLTLINHHQYNYHHPYGFLPELGTITLGSPCPLAHMMKLHHPATSSPSAPASPSIHSTIKLLLLDYCLVFSAVMSRTRRPPQALHSENTKDRL